MFGRRKKSDGFEWHKYIRTTIKLRREQRQQRVMEARQAAAHQMSAAGSALAVGSKAAGAAARDGARAGLGVAGLVLQAMWSLFAAATLALGRRLAVAARPLIQALARPNIGGPIALAGAIALGAGIGRYRGTGLDHETAITLGIGILLLFSALPLFSSVTGIRLPRIPARVGLMAVAVAAMAAGAAWFANGGKVNLTGLTSQLPFVGASKPLQGRAAALSGDLMRVGGTTVRLAAVEAPERQQTCGAGNRRFRCGSAAEAALARLVNGRTVSCTLSGADAAGRPLAYCTRGETDINGELVRKGHVFADGGFFAIYAPQEREARAAKAGIWAVGEPERPADYRARVGKGSGGERRTERAYRGS